MQAVFNTDDANFTKGVMNNLIEIKIQSETINNTTGYGLTDTAQRNGGAASL